MSNLRLFSAVLVAFVRMPAPELLAEEFGVPADLAVVARDFHDVALGPVNLARGRL